jgi:hypothetical protein
MGALMEADQIVFLGKIVILLFLVFLTLSPTPLASPLYFSVVGLYLVRNNFKKVEGVI